MDTNETKDLNKILEEKAIETMPDPEFIDHDEILTSLFDERNEKEEQMNLNQLLNNTSMTAPKEFPSESKIQEGREKKLAGADDIFIKYYNGKEDVAKYKGYVETYPNIVNDFLDLVNKFKLTAITGVIDNWADSVDYDGIQVGDIGVYGEEFGRLIHPAASIRVFKVKRETKIPGTYPAFDRLNKLIKNVTDITIPKGYNNNLTSLITNVKTDSNNKFDFYVLVDGQNKVKALVEKMI